MTGLGRDPLVDYSSRNGILESYLYSITDHRSARLSFGYAVRSKIRHVLIFSYVGRIVKRHIAC